LKDNKKAEEIAEQRVKLLSPLLAAGLDAAKAMEIRQQICTDTGISDRTIRRYLTDYKKDGFSGLKPKSKNQTRTDVAIPTNIINEAITLRREVPSRSINQIIQILEWEGLVSPGEIKRSTLQEKLSDRGYSTRQMKMYAGGGLAARRYQKSFRNQMWQSDLKYACYLPIGPGGTLKQVYLAVFLDDATRFVLHAEFFSTLDQIIVEDCFRQAIQKYGVPESVLFDNGKQYRTKWMGRACAKMGIRLMYARPYSPECKGKIEVFNKYIDSFQNEFALEKNNRTLERLNELFWVWLDECYQNKPHSGLTNNISPENAYRIDIKPIKYLEPELVATAFLHCEERKVDKSGCISFEGVKYEVGISFIGCKVDIIYDPLSTDEITIEYEGHAAFKAKKLVIGEHSGKRPKLPEHLLPVKVEESRLLKQASKQNDKRVKTLAPAVAYRGIGKVGGSDV
jgi:transposase InsO family protein